MQDPRTLVTEVNPQPSAPDFALRLSSKAAAGRAEQHNASAAPVLDGMQQKKASQSLPPGETRDACSCPADIPSWGLESRSRRDVAMVVAVVASFAQYASCASLSAHIPYGMLLYLSGVSYTLRYSGCPAESAIVDVEVPAATKVEGVAVTVCCEDVHIRIHNFSVPVRSLPHLLIVHVCRHRIVVALLGLVAAPARHVHSSNTLCAKCMMRDDAVAGPRSQRMTICTCN